MKECFRVYVKPKLIILWHLLTTLLFIGLFNVIWKNFRNYFDSQLFLEYLKVFLTWPTAFVTVATIVIVEFRDQIRIWLKNLKIDYAGVSLTPQQSLEEPVSSKIESIPQEGPGEVVAKKDDPNDETVQWRTNAYLWEYRYLSLYLVRNTQLFLDWLYDLNRPWNLVVAGSWWMSSIPDPEEQSAIILALNKHYLVHVADGKIEITPKGKEYVEFRGKMPKPTNKLEETIEKVTMTTSA